MGWDQDLVSGVQLWGTANSNIDSKICFTLVCHSVICTTAHLKGSMRMFLGTQHQRTSAEAETQDASRVHEASSAFDGGCALSTRRPQLFRRITCASSPPLPAMRLNPNLQRLREQRPGEHPSILPFLAKTNLSLTFPRSYFFITEFFLNLRRQKECLHNFDTFSAGGSTCISCRFFPHPVRRSGLSQAQLILGQWIRLLSVQIRNATGSEGSATSCLPRKNVPSWGPQSHGEEFFVQACNFGWVAVFQHKHKVTRFRKG